jgi:hypothetical protein
MRKLKACRAVLQKFYKTEHSTIIDRNASQECGLAFRTRTDSVVGGSAGVMEYWSVGLFLITPSRQYSFVPVKF